MTSTLHLSQVKITPRHLERKAVVYIRQSSLKQVREHLDSQLTQRALVGRAQSLGWHPERIEVFDGDLGQSATGVQARDDFKALAAEVALGHVGIVFGWQVSRLARNNAEWYQLLDLAALVGTLIGDTDGVYDPRLYNDRLLRNDARMPHCLRWGGMASLLGGLGDRFPQHDRDLPSKAPPLAAGIFTRDGMKLGGRSSMHRYILRRLLLMLPTFLGVAMLVFLLMRVIPGDIVELRFAQGQFFNQHRVAKERDRLGLDRPVWRKFIDWVWGIVRLDFGLAMWSGQPIAHHIAIRLRLSLQLAVMATVVAVFLAIPLGTLAALKQDTWVDYLLRVFSIAGLATPSFWLGIVMFLVLLHLFGWIPPMVFLPFWESPCQ